MSTLVYKTRWRPLRVGWCVQKGDVDSLVKAFRVTHCLWGGRFNPIIVVDDEATARHRIDLFRVDVLWPVGQDEKSTAFAKSINHLPSPFMGEALFENLGHHKQCILLDVTYPIRIFFEQNVKDKVSPTLATTLYHWENDDPLARSFEATFGAYPPTIDTGTDYQQLAIQYTNGKETNIARTGVIERAAVQAISPNSLTWVELRPELLAERYEYEFGFFIGDAGSFSHLVDFWNIRAAGIDLFFLDLRFLARFDPLIAELERIVRALPPHPILGQQRLGLWLASDINETDDLSRFTVPFETRKVWKGMKVTPPVMHFPEHSFVAQISEGESHPTLTLELREKPGFNEPPFNRQQLVLTVKPILNYSRDDRFLFTVPFIPELNEYFGREHHYDWNKARAEKDGLGIITHLWTDHITLFGMERFSFGRQLFKTFGITAEVSQAGLICDQLIRQMGGIQGCRAFKIKGVRTLIDRFSPTQNFTRSEALRLIGANFGAYEQLYIGVRDKEHLTPPDVFSYLLEQRVFRVGLQLQCPTCKLEFWRALDDVQTLLTCEYCGKEFNVTPQLKGRDWAYRPSGLFGRGDKQEGGVPVALTLQQLDTTLHRPILWLPALNLQPLTAEIEKCEIDFVLLYQNWRGRVTLVMGECKTNMEIDEDDVRNLSKVADAFPRDRFDVFLVFSKAGEFTPDEIQRCRAADSNTCRRTILLSERELEPYFIYERTAKEFAIEETAVSLEDMVEATRGIYFEPRRRSGV
jgi:hypothetical protein